MRGETTPTNITIQKSSDGINSTHLGLQIECQECEKSRRSIWNVRNCRGCGCFGANVEGAVQEGCGEGTAEGCGEGTAEGAAVGAAVGVAVQHALDPVVAYVPPAQLVQADAPLPE